MARAHYVIAKRDGPTFTATAPRRIALCGRRVTIGAKDVLPGMVCVSCRKSRFQMGPTQELRLCWT